MILIIIIPLVMIGFAAVLWANGIEYMRDNHPEYKGEDFLN